MRTLAALVAALLLSLAPRAAWSHARSASYSRWDLDPEGAMVTARVALLDLSRVGDVRAFEHNDSALASVLQPALTYLRGARPCAAVSGSARRVPAETGWLALRWRVRCASSGDGSLRSELFAREAPGHLHFASVRDERGRVSERVLTEAVRVWPLAEPRRFRATLSAFFALGVRHILSGADHLAFLLALALPWRRVRSLLVAITGFTLGHGLSVALAGAGVLHTQPRAVESLIGLSVALVAMEDVWLVGNPRDDALRRAGPAAVFVLALIAWLRPGAPALALTGAGLFAACTGGLQARGASPERIRPLSAALFGLVHGFGFAGALAGIELPRGHLLGALVGFNLGVEAGQLLVLAAMAPALLWLARRRESTRARVVEVCAAALVALGTYWCVSRAFGRG